MPALEIIDPRSNEPVVFEPLRVGSLFEEGVVREWFGSLRYGLLIPDDGGATIFLPAVALRDISARELPPGQRVRYTKIPNIADPTRTQATRVSLLFPILGPAVNPSERPETQPPGPLVAPPARALLLRGVGDGVSIDDVRTVLSPLADISRIVGKCGLQAVVHLRSDADLDVVLRAFPDRRLGINGHHVYLVSIPAPPSDEADKTACPPADPCGIGDVPSSPTDPPVLSTESPVQDPRRPPPSRAEPIPKSRRPASPTDFIKHDKVGQLRQMFPASSGHSVADLRRALHRHGEDVASAAAALLDHPPTAKRYGWTTFTKDRNTSPAGAVPAGIAPRPKPRPKPPKAHTVAVPSILEPRDTGDETDLHVQLLLQKWEWVTEAVMRAVLTAADHDLASADALLSELYVDALQEAQTVEAAIGSKAMTDSAECAPRSSSASSLLCRGEGDCRGACCPTHGKPAAHWRTRKAASDLDETAQRLLRRAAVAHAHRDPHAARQLVSTSRDMRRKAECLHAEAAGLIELELNDPGGNVWQLDLHGLRVHEALAALERRLERLRDCDPPEGRPAALTVVVGRGRHSANGQPCIPNAVQAYLMGEGLLFKAGQVGCIEVRPKPR